VGLKLNGTHQLLAYADDVNLMGNNIDTINNNTESLIDASKEVGLAVNVEKKTKYMLVSRDQNAGHFACPSQNFNFPPHHTLLPDTAHHALQAPGPQPKLVYLVGLHSHHFSSPLSHLTLLDSSCGHTSQSCSRLLSESFVAMPKQ
jgi:hypothetical protein